MSAVRPASTRVEWACAYADDEEGQEVRPVDRATAQGWVAYGNAHNRPASLVRRIVTYSTWERA